MASGLWKIAVLALGTLFAMASADKDFDILTKSSDTFSSNLLSKVRKSFDNKNVAVSPASLHPALAMVEVGAKGKTKRQILKALAMPNKEVDWVHMYSKLNRYFQDPAFSTATALFCDSSTVLKSSYVDKVSSMGASLKRANFENGVEAAETINNWVNTRTNGRISKLYEPSDVKGSKLVIVNAIYFKAEWVRKFITLGERDFHSPTGIIKVPMMSREAKFLYGQPNGLHAQVVVLPYKHSHFEMIIILPSEDTHIDVVESKLAKIGLSQIRKTLTQRKVEVIMPTFKIESAMNLVKPLKAMGITRLFGSLADLSGMSEGNNLQVSDVRQKVFIEVNEQGTEAAAATGVNMMIKSSPFDVEEEVLRFHADRPFLFSVHAEGLQLVTGRMMGTSN